MLSGICSEKDTQDLENRLGLKWKDVEDACDDHKGFLKPVIAALLKPKNKLKYKPSWRKLAQVAGCMDKKCGDAVYHRIIKEKKETKNTKLYNN